MLLKFWDERRDRGFFAILEKFYFGSKWQEFAHGFHADAKEADNSRG